MIEKLIEIDRFDSNTGVVYFKYLGDDNKNLKIRMSNNNLTLYYTEFPIGPNRDTLYYVGFNESLLGNIDSVDVDFFYDESKESFYIKIKEHSTEKNKFLNLESRIEDPSYYSFAEVFVQKIYDDKLIRINEGDIVVDIGANYGFFSLYAEQFNPSKIISIEPSKIIFEYLQKNFKSGKTVNKAVSGNSGIGKFSDDLISSASSALSEDGGYEVEIIGINDLLQNLELEKVDFLKIDCEGAEEEIFQEISSSTLNKINKLVVEYHSQEILEIIIEKLNSSDFKIERIEDGLIFAYNKNYFKAKKKIALVSTYCDTQEKKDIFLDLVKKVKSCGVDVIAISPLALDAEHIEACDYLYFTKENPILEWPVRLFTFWREEVIDENKTLVFHRGVGDYSWAALYHVKKLTQIAMEYDYDIFYHMIYDLEIDENVERALNDFEGNIVYPRRDPHNPETLWETTLHLMSFDRDLMKKIEKEITLEEYLSTNGVAEGEVYKWKKKFNIFGSPNPVRDKIFYWKDFDFFNYSPVDKFKMFISKNEDMDIWTGGENVRKEVLPNNFRIVFYSSDNIGDLILSANGVEYKISPKSWEINEIPLNSKNIRSLKIKYEDIEYDLTKEYEKIMLNQIYFNYKN